MVQFTSVIEQGREEPPNAAYNGSWGCPTLPEQTAIAKILSDMDAEISALEGKLSKRRQVKAGMMSVLLSGEGEVGVKHRGCYNLSMRTDLFDRKPGLCYKISISPPFLRGWGARRSLTASAF
jgi:hypothetical protein